MVETFAGVMIVTLVTKDAVHIFGDKHVEALGFGRPHEALIAGAVNDRRAGDGAVVEDRNNRQPLTLAKLAT